MGVDLEAPDLPTLYAEAATALTDTITDRNTVEPRQERRIHLSADSREELMVDWLEELLYVFEVESLLFHHADVTLRPDPDGGALPGKVWRLEAILHGEPHDPARHPHRVLVKAITWHALHVTPTEEGWTGKVIFDI